MKLLESHESDWEGELLGEPMHLAPSGKLLPGVPLAAFPGESLWKHTGNPGSMLEASEKFLGALGTLGILLVFCKTQACIFIVRPLDQILARSTS